MEITSELSVTVEEETLIDMHSVLNVLNVIIYELYNLAEYLDEPPELEKLHDNVAGVASLLRDPEEAHRQVANVHSFIVDFNTVVASTLERTGRKDDKQVIESLANIVSIFDILEIRAAEIVARHSHPGAWVNHDIQKLRNNMLCVLRAIERNSKGGYRIVYNVAEHEEGNYLVNFDISSFNGSTVSMPAIFQDVMRDLLANARKYTSPGGTINGGLYNSERELRYVVSDTGVGILPGELEHIVAFGRRGSNVQDRQTRGGGFGLTKAYYVTRKFGGRMWIDSPLSQDGGTRIEIRIPVPAIGSPGP